MHDITLAKALHKECSKLKDAVMISGLSSYYCQKRKVSVGILKTSFFLIYLKRALTRRSMPYMYDIPCAKVPLHKD